MDQSYGLALFATFFVLLGLLGFLVFRRVSRQIAQTTRSLDRTIDRLGFPAVSDPDFAARLGAHFRPKSFDQPFVRGLRKKAGPGCTIWLCQIYWRGDEVWPAAVVVESSRLALPRFRLFPRVSNTADPGVPDMNRHLHEMWEYDDAHRDFAPIALDGTRHTLSGPKAAWTETLFTPAFRAWLNQADGLAISGEGQLLVVWPSWPTSAGWQPALVHDVETNVRRAESCVTHLQQRG